MSHEDLAKALLVIVTLLTVLALSPCALASDPELNTDFAVPPSVDLASLNGGFFTYTGLRGGVNTTMGQYAFKKVTVSEFPALEGLGISYFLMYFPIGSVLQPHVHPHASKLIFVIEGALTVGFVDTTNKLYKRLLLKGDCFVVPKAMIHYMANLNFLTKTKVIFSFSSSNPGTIKMPNAIFGSDIPNSVLTQSFGVSNQVIEALEAPYA